MDDAFELLDPRNAQAFLKQFSAEARRKGEACFRRGAVQDVVPEEPGVAYSAVVKDGDHYEVDLEYDPAEGWSGSCSCPLGSDCEHIVAAMRALLAEHSRAAVRSLSTGGPSASASLAAARSRPAASDAGELVRRLLAARKRPLKAEEKKFLGKVRTVYERCCQAGRITHWDFEEMGLRLGGYGWDALQIWPTLPENDYLFWLYVANAAQQRQVQIPEFMQPITDLSAIQNRLARWERERQIQRWKEKLGSLHLPSAPPADGQALTDLRVLVEEKEICLQWLRPGQTTFDTIKHAQLRQFAANY